MRNSVVERRSEGARVERTATRSKKRLSIAYVLQNAGNKLTADVGQAILIKHTVRGLEAAGHAVNVFRLHGRSVARFDDLDDFNEVSQVPLGLTGTGPFKLVESGVRRVQREVKAPYFALFDAYRFYEACCRFLPHYDLCHEYGGLFSLGAAVACRRKGIPYVLTVDADPLVENVVKGTPLRGLRASVARIEARITYRLAEKIICVSEPARDHLVQSWQVGPEKIVVIPNGVDTELFRPDYDPGTIRAEVGLDGLIVTFVGGFQHWHGLDRLVASFVRVLAEVPAAHLLLVGDGPARSTVDRKIAELGVGAAVTVTGLVPQTHVPRLLAAADVAVLPYPPLPEELWFSPLKLYEYMAAGKAIVASRAGQVSEVIRDGYNGRLVEPGDVGELANAIVALLENAAERERLGRNARRQAVEQHSWEERISRLEDVYETVLSHTLVQV